MAPLSVWTYWFAWSPVLAIGSGIAAGYILTALLPPDSAILTWSVTLVDLGFLKDGLTLRINSTFFIGAALLLVVFAAQHHGILRTARIQTVIGIAVIVPLLIVGVVPLLTGDVVAANFSPFTPLALDESKNIIPGEWNLPVGPCSLAECSLPAGRHTASRPRCAIRGSSAIRRPTPIRPSSIRACSASSSSSSCPSPSRLPRRREDAGAWHL
jgi:hypothetical protein